MQKSILQNAIESIQVGVEDFKSGSHPRLISATRNIFAGILLLYKSKLSELSPKGTDEVLIKRNIRPVMRDDGVLDWVGRGSKTVDVQQIINRFKDLNISIDEKTLLKIQATRNDLEHYYLGSISTDAMKGLLAKSFALIRDFSEQYLGLKTVELLGAETYGILAEVTEFYKNECELCENEIQSIAGISDLLKQALVDFPCEECGSELITVKDSKEKTFICKSCSFEYTYEKIVPESHSIDTTTV